MNPVPMNEVKPSPVKSSCEGFRTMKIYDATALALEKLSEQINGSGPKRVQWKGIVDLAVSKVNPSELRELREKKLTDVV